MLSAVDRQIFSALVGRRRISFATRVAVVGNCQATGVGHAVRMLVPKATVDVFAVGQRSVSSISVFSAALATYDIVLCSEFQSGILRGGGSSELLKAMPSIIKYPVITFMGFHPDFIALHHGRASIKGPMGPYHSALAVFAFLAGLTAAEAEALFAPDIYDILGYFDLWKAAQNVLVATGREAGIDLSRDVLRWLRRGCFMHTGIHPKGFVLFDIAKGVLSRTGISIQDIEFDAFNLDKLSSDYICPVYPSIAQRLGFSGSYLFKRPERRGGHSGFFDLRSFIAASFETYRDTPASQLQHDRVEAWLEDGQALHILTDAARIRRRA